ncbi:MAG: hypothetical protein ACRENG_35570 [bacterium]
MFRHYFFMILIVALYGCTSSRLINPRNSADLAKISIKPDQKVRVTMSNGHWFIGSNLQVTPDSTRFFVGRQFLSVANSEVKEITHVRRGKGALQGLGLGLLTGTAVGGIIGIAAYKPCDNCFIDFGPGFSLMAGSALGILLGGPFGALIGADIGSKSKYQFQESIEPATVQKPLAPTTENLRLWKENILNLLSVDSKVRQTWKEYARRHNLNDDKNVWVNSLHESDFQDFAGSGKQLREWLINKFFKIKPNGGV